MASPSPTETPTRAPRALDVVVALVTIEAVAQVVALWSDRAPRPQASEDIVTIDISDMRSTGAGAVLLSAVILSKIVLAVRTRQLKAGSALLLLAAEAVGVLAVLVATGWPMGVRLAMLGTIIVVFVLVGRSLSAFPTPPLPDIRSTGDLE